VISATLTAPRLLAPLTTKSTSAAPRAEQPLTPIEDRRVGVVSSNHLGGVWLDLMPQPRHQTISRSLAFGR
jgi:hypothetical protein